MSERRQTKVLKLHILKPTGGMKWDELGKMLHRAMERYGLHQGFIQGT